MEKLKKGRKCNPCVMIPVRMVAEITGLTPQHVRDVRAGKRGKRQSFGSEKIKIIDNFLNNEIGIVVRRAKGHDVLQLPVNHRNKKTA